MEKSMKCFVAAVLLALFVTPVFSQFTLSGEIRPRAEIRHGYRTLADTSSKTAFFVSQRSRLNFDYKHEKFQVGFSLQDVRVWGDEEQLRDVSSAAVHEAWGEVFFTDWLALKSGRQELIYDDQRLLGNVDWVQQARSHDAAVLKFSKSGWQAHLGAAYNNESEKIFGTPYTLANYRTLTYLWVNKTFKEKFTASIMAITDGFHSTDSAQDLHYRLTAGPHLAFKSGDFNATGTFYYQAGKDIFGTNISAYMFAVGAFYKAGDFTFGVGLDYLSGTDALDTENDKARTFNTLYATNHKFYGYMDYFLNVPAHTAGGGLGDIYAKLKYSFSDKTALALDYHYFMLSNNVIDISMLTEAIDKGLGSEIDLVFNYNIHKMVNLKAGYSMLLATTSMEALKGGDKSAFQDWGWVMLTFKPKFFESKNRDGE